MREKPNVSIIQLIFMNLAFLGLQAGMAFEIANMSGIYEMYGVTPSIIPILWLAPFLAGLLVQPIIGVMSDKTWCILGRRRPYILIGTIISALSLLMMFLSKNLIILVIAVWGFSIFSNVVMGPLRTYVADSLNEKQMTLGFSIQSIFMAFGSIFASCLPLSLSTINPSLNSSNSTKILLYSAWICIIIILITGTITSFCGKEHPPYAEQKKMQKEKLNYFAELWGDLKAMPNAMKELAVIHFFGWMGVFLMFMFFPIAIEIDVFNAVPGSGAYIYGIEWAGLCFGIYSAVQFFSSFIIPEICSKWGEKKIYFIFMLLGGLGLVSECSISNKYMLFIPMFGVGLMYAALNIIPYSILGKILTEEKKGAYIGIFNIFITLPGILVSLFFGFVINYIFSNDKTWGVICAGICMLIACLFILKAKCFDKITYTGKNN